MISSIVSGISKVGEGFDQPNQNFPIDIQAAKLLEWLLDRRLLGKNWKGGLPKIREMLTKIEEEIPSYTNVTGGESDPNDTLWTELINSNQKLDYFVISRIFSTLKSAAAAAGVDGKSFFGQKYSDKRLQMWSELTSSYEKGFIYLGESAQTLGEYLNFDIPNLKSDMEKYKQQLNELHHKQTNHERNIQMYKTQLTQQCNDLKIAPSNNESFREALLSLTNELPNIFEQVVDLTRTSPVHEAIAFHQAFTTFTKQITASTPATSHPTLPGTFPTLRYIIEHGNETVQEMQNRIHSISSIMLSAPTAIEKKGEEEIQIDWVTVSTSEEPEQEVTINWEDGTGEIIDGSTPAIVWEDVTNQLDLDIEVVEAEAGELSGAEEDTEVQQIEASEESAKESLLAHAPTRNKFLDDIFELEAFLQYRKEDLSDTKGKTAALLDPLQLLLPQLQGDTEKSIRSLLEKHTKDVVQKQSSTVTEIAQKFQTGGRLLQLLEIKASGRYMDRLVGGLQQKQDLIDKSAAGVAAVAVKREEVNKCISETQAHLDDLIAKSHALKRNIEMALSKVYNREVTIVSPLL